MPTWPLFLWMPGRRMDPSMNPTALATTNVDLNGTKRTQIWLQYHQGYGIQALPRGTQTEAD